MAKPRSPPFFKVTACMWGAAKTGDQIALWIKGLFSHKIS
jgi:hypothetical protein